jgi:hypothetical protein
MTFVVGIGLLILRATHQRGALPIEPNREDDRQAFLPVGQLTLPGFMGTSRQADNDKNDQEPRLI